MTSFVMLNSHPMSHLRQEIAESNKKLGAITGYSKGMKKAAMIGEMMKHKARFSHIKMYVKPFKPDASGKISFTPEQLIKKVAAKDRARKRAAEKKDPFKPDASGKISITPEQLIKKVEALDRARAKGKGKAKAAPKKEKLGVRVRARAAAKPKDTGTYSFEDALKLL